MSRLRLDLIVRRYPKLDISDDASSIKGRSVDRWTWRLWSGSRIVSTSGNQLFSRRIDCARGAEVGACVWGVQQFLRRGTAQPFRYGPDMSIVKVKVRILDERERSADA